MPTVSRPFRGSAGGRFGVFVTNAPAVIKKLQAILVRDERRLRMRAERIGIMVAAESIRLIKSGYYKPAVDTGTMWRGIGYEVKKATPYLISIEVGVEVYYAIYVHEGTVHMEQRAFFVDAIRNKRQEIRMEIIRALTGV